MFTKEQIDEIREKLAVYGTKDSDLESVESIQGTDIIPIVREGENKKISVDKAAASVSSIFIFRPETNINNMLETGFYWGNIGRPEDSDEDEHYHVSVKAASDKDNNGKYSIEQLLYSIKYPSKIFMRVGFTPDKSNPNAVEWDGFQQIGGNLNFIAREGSDANEDVETGFYGYVNSHIPEEATSWGSLAVRRADKVDNGGYISIEQIFYGRNGDDNGKVWFRLMFYNINTQQYQIFNWSSCRNTPEITVVSALTPEVGNYSTEEGFTPGTYILRYEQSGSWKGGTTAVPTSVIYPLTKCLRGDDSSFFYISKKPANIRYTIPSRSGYASTCSINENTGAITYPVNITGSEQIVQVKATYTVGTQTFELWSTKDFRVNDTEQEYTYTLYKDWGSASSAMTFPWVPSENEGRFTLSDGTSTTAEEFFRSLSVDTVVGKYVTTDSGGTILRYGDLKIGGISSSVSIVDENNNTVVTIDNSQGNNANFVYQDNTERVVVLNLVYRT